tara:strand:- start:507 stop:668 length:162 start_codon:yes stop_codon:yes gene_type:complete
MLDHLPDTLSAELNRLGVYTTSDNIKELGDFAQRPKEYTFKKPNLDEHGEPDF